MTNQVSLAKRIYLVATEPEGAGILFSLLTVGVLFALMVPFVSGPLSIVFAALALVVVGAVAFLIKTGLSMFDAHAGYTARKRAIAWARAARDDQEVRSRMLSIESLGPVAALAGAGIFLHEGGGPFVNVDGTPMGGAGVDIHGNPFGVTSSVDYSEGIESTGLGMDIGGYQPPIGMGDSGHSSDY